MTAINSNRAIRGPVTAVPVVAGKGVRLVADTANNRWVVEADETVLWENSTPKNLTSITLSESWKNFERIRFLWVPWTASNSRGEAVNEVATAKDDYIALTAMWCDTNNTDRDSWFRYLYSVSASGTTFSLVRGGYSRLSGASYADAGNDNQVAIYKIVGINRVASA